MNNKYKEQLKRIPRDRNIAAFTNKFDKKDIAIIKECTRDCKEQRENFNDEMCEAAIEYITQETLTLKELTPLFVALWMHKNIPFMSDVDIDDLLLSAGKMLKRSQSLQEIEALGYEFNPVLMLKVIKLNGKLLLELGKATNAVAEMHDRVVRYRKKLFAARHNAKKR